MLSERTNCKVSDKFGNVYPILAQYMRENGWKLNSCEKSTRVLKTMRGEDVVLKS